MLVVFLFDFLGCNIVSQLSKCLKMTFWEGCLKVGTYVKLLRLFITISFTKDERRLFQSIR